ncbi:MAG: hypothetical protein JO040_15015 [Gemmatimonadetes bacterium]|nr:hypothetical protein [Gemmatimonadota bacterium]
MFTEVHALRELLERRFPDAVPVTHRTAGALATGIAALDRILPGGGLPRGRLVGWAPGGGATAALRAACLAAQARGERTAWVDGRGTVCGDSWRGEAALFRPNGARAALECAEELVRSGGFALVVLAGARTPDTERVRLSRAAHEGGGTLVMVDGGGFMAGVRLASRIRPDGFRWRTDPFGEPAEVESVTVRTRVEALGWSKEAEFSLSVARHDLRLSVEPTLGDRRGAAR